MKTLLLAFVLASAACAHAADAVSLPFKTANSLILVSVTVDGQPKTLILDTGAQRTIVHERDAHVERRNIAVVLGTNVCMMSVVFIDMATMQTNVVRAVDGVHADGILGQDFLSNFHSLNINYKSHTITLQ